MQCLMWTDHQKGSIILAVRRLNLRREKSKCRSSENTMWEEEQLIPHTTTAYAKYNSQKSRQMTHVLVCLCQTTWL